MQCEVRNPARHLSRAPREASRPDSAPGIPPASGSFYAQWRARCGLVSSLRDEHAPPPERLLQAIWQHQRLHRDQLTTLDGRRVRVLHPGFGNVEGGPDFRHALVQIGDEAPRSGDVEVDLRPGGWRAHGHNRNPAFHNVILHVVWEADRDVGGPPLLPIRPALDAPLGELSLWLEREPAKSFPESLRGKCSAPLRSLPPDQVQALLHQAAKVRLQTKAAQFQARARHVGWEQALWEGLFRALGYKHNVWPMQCLAETRPRWTDGARTPLALQSRLLGIGGLLPSDVDRKQAAAGSYVRTVWDQWWRERTEFEDCLLPQKTWRFHGLRPANHPQRRLALAAHWLGAGKLVAQIERWCAASIPERALLDSLVSILQVERDDFWSWHWTFRSARLKNPQPLLGTPRVTDLAVNVILPWLWARAGSPREISLAAQRPTHECIVPPGESNNTRLQEEILNRYFAWPGGEDNAVLRLARRRLLGDAARGPLRSAAAQQGFIQIVRDFCDHSNAVCDDCRLPELVTDWGGQC